VIIAIIIGLIVAALVLFVLRAIGIPELIAALVAVLVFIAFVFGGGYY
jgi:hypothetical protein